MLSRLFFAAVVFFAGAVTPLVTAQESLEKNLAEALLAAEKGPSEQAVQLLSRVIEEKPDYAPAYYHRGRENFRLGRFEQSVADFDRYLQLEPQAASRQWERGIACYYAGKFAEGAKQFELYQTFHDQDVENSTWRYLCQAKVEGIDKARAALLPIERDRRIPMMQIYDLYRGKAKPDDVLTATQELPKETRQGAEFYAHLYLGLWYEAAGQNKLAAKHIFAAEQRPINHYMFDVARIHAEILRKQQAADQPLEAKK